MMSTQPEGELDLRFAIAKGDEAVARLRRRIIALPRRSSRAHAPASFPIDPVDVGDLIDAYLALRRRLE